MTDTNQMITLVHITTVPQSLYFFQGQVSYLKKNGFEVHAISSQGELSTQFAEQEAITVHVVNMERRIAPIADLISLWNLYFALRRIKPNIVHSHTPKAGLLGTIAARLAGVPIVFLSIFGLRQMTKTGFMRLLLDFITRLTCFLANRIWCDSFSMKDYVRKNKLAPDSKIVVLGHGSVGGINAQDTFSPEQFDKVSRSKTRSYYSIPEDALVLGYIGRIVRDKGMIELASAWNNLCEVYPKLHMILVGDVERYDPIPEEILLAWQENPRIHLTGRIAKDQIPRLYAVMDIFVMPSYREGFGIANMEASAMKLPVVSTQIPGCMDSVKDGVTGTLVPAHNTKALETAIRRYLDDPELRRQHGQAGRERVLRDFRPEDIWQGLLVEYRRLLTEKKQIRDI